MLNLDGLMPHQARGVRWLLDNPRGMLAWEMGVGKTATAARAWENTAEQGPLLVLSLASARENWRREIQRFSIDPAWPASVHVVFDHKVPIQRNVSAVVVNYDKLQNVHFLESLCGKRWGAIVADEAHVLKTPSARRTRAVYGGGRAKGRRLLDSTERFWPLTGTPMPNHPAELWAHAYNLWPDAIRYNGEVMDLQTYEAGYCNVIEGEFGKKIVGGRNLEELRQRLSPHMNRLKRKEVLTLPPLRIDSWPLDMEIAGAACSTPDAGELCEKLHRFGRIETLDNATLDALLACINAEWLPLATLRRETGILKSLASAILLKEELGSGTQKVVAFAQHLDCIRILTHGLGGFEPAIIHGGVPAGKRQHEIDRFNEDPKCRVFIGQLQAAGSSINLQAADNVVFVEASWSPGENDQALSRVYRAGQTKPVFVRFTYLGGSVDETVNRALARKAAMIAQVIG